MGSIGALDQRILIESVVLTSDGAGGSVKSWTSLGTVWAGVRPLTGREDVEQGGTAATLECEFTVRNRDDFAEDDRVTWQGETYNIRRIMRKGPRELYLKFVAERGVAT